MKVRLLIPVAILSLVAGACTTGLGEPLAQGGDSSVVIDRTDRPEQPTGPVGSDDSKPYVETLELSISAIQKFWSDSMPSAYGRDFQVIPSDKIFAYSSTVDPPACGPGPKPSYQELAGNAFYCTEGEFIAFDDEALMPQLYENFGSYAVAMVLAHEWGHAVQDQMGNSDSTQTVYLEQQADCFAGAWTKWLADGNDPALPLNEGTLDAALGGLLEFRDEPGTSSQDPSAHGSGFDRVRAFRDGFGAGVDTCVGYETSPPQVLQLPFTEGDYQTGGNLAYDELGDVLFPDLTAWIAREFPSYAEPTAQDYDPGSGPVNCGSTTVGQADAEDKSFYCASDRTVRWDGPWLQGINSSTGDFASGLLVGMQYGVALQSQLGESDEAISSEEGVQQRVCLMGSYAGSLVQEFPTPQEHEISISGGDLDEALTALIAFTDRTQTGAIGSSLAFDRIEAFQNGVLDGTAVCGF